MLFNRSDDPKTIKLRFVSVTISVAISSLIIAWWRSGESLCEVLTLCPNVSVFRSVAEPLALTAVLFLGPLVVLKDTYTWEEIKSVKLADHLNLMFMRNYVVAPLSEEFTFRSALHAILKPYWSSVAVMVLSSVLFSLAHSHHYLLQNIEGSKPVPLAASLVQLSYTFVFGMYSSVFISRTNCLLTSVAIHIFCNALGFPDFVSA